jgi:hypothetical protein
MAVIGARPATSPWGLWRRATQKPRVRPRAARRVRRGRVSARLVAPVADIRPVLVAIVVAAALALFYLSQSTRVAATGYEIDALEAELAARRADQQQLIWAIGQARSPAEVTRHARRELHLVHLKPGAVTFAPEPDEPAH